MLCTCHLLLIFHSPYEQMLIMNVKKEGKTVMHRLISQKSKDDKTLLQLALEKTMISRIGILLKYGAGTYV